VGESSLQGPDLAFAGHRAEVGFDTSLHGEVFDHLDQNSLVEAFAIIEWQKALVRTHNLKGLGGNREEPECRDDKQDYSHSVLVGLINRARPSFARLCLAS